MGIPTALEQASRYAMMCDIVVSQGYRNTSPFDLVGAKAAKLVLVEFRPRDVVLAHPESWAPTHAVWIDADGVIWPQASYNYNDIDVRADVVRRAVEREDKPVIKRLARNVRAYLASLT